uniref:Putative secreted peptide n=1 Tax=Anopheles braziliensis TaxID=58242 RepID=A0A2M3ZWL3_9DIPT
MYCLARDRRKRFFLTAAASRLISSLLLAFSSSWARNELACSRRMCSPFFWCQLTINSSSVGSQMQL